MSGMRGLRDEDGELKVLTTAATRVNPGEEGVTVAHEDSGKEHEREMAGSLGRADREVTRTTAMDMLEMSRETIAAGRVLLGPIST